MKCRPIQKCIRCVRLCVIEKSLLADRSDDNSKISTLAREIALARQGSSESVSDALDGQGSSESVSDTLDRQGSSESVSDALDRQRSSESLSDSIETWRER